MIEKRNHKISLEEAIELTSNFRKSVFKGESYGGLFDKESVLEVLQQPGCDAMRYYHGIDSDDNNVLILIGVDKAGNDILNGIIIEKAFPCPPYCGDINNLNSESVKEKRLLV